MTTVCLIRKFDSEIIEVVRRDTHKYGLEGIYGDKLDGGDKYTFMFAIGCARGVEKEYMRGLEIL